MKLSKGQIGVIYWYEDVTMPMTDAQRQYIIDQDAKAAMYALIQSAALNPNQGYVDVQAEYEKARRQGAKRAEDLQQNRVLKKTHTQVGQKESQDEILAIERKPEFRGWQNPEIIEELLNYEE